MRALARPATTIARVARPVTIGIQSRRSESSSAASAAAGDGSQPKGGFISVSLHIHTGAQRYVRYHANGSSLLLLCNAFLSPCCTARKPSAEMTTLVCSNTPSSLRVARCVPGIFTLLSPPEREG